MEAYKLLFVGLGSIAKRHIRNLREIEKNGTCQFIIDAYRHSSGKDKVNGIDQSFTLLSDVPGDYDAVFITNPTDHHLSALKQVHNKGKNFFVEKPVVSLDQMKEAKEFELHKDTVYYVACPLRYNAVIQYIKTEIEPETVISVRSISSSYLPDWRPGQDYRTIYSAHKDMGGGVSIDLIHEWDYLTYLFGWPSRVHQFIGKKSRLEIDSDDYAVYIAEYANMIAELHLDYFGRKTIREIQLFTQEDTIVGDLVNNRIDYLVSGKKVEFKENRDDYQKRELEHFLELIRHTAEQDKDDFLHGIQVLELTQGKKL